MDKAVDNGFKETTAFCNPPKIMAMMVKEMESILDSSIQKKRGRTKSFV